MKLPKQIQDKLTDEQKAALLAKNNEKIQPQDYLENLKLGDKNIKEKTRNVLWSVYQKEGYMKFMQVINNMKTFKNRDYNDLIQAKGEIAEVVLEIIIQQFVQENNIKDWWVIRSLILGNEKNKKFSTEIDMILVTPLVVTIFEVKSYNGEKVITGKCNLKATNSGQVLEKDIFKQNTVHIKAFWDNFEKFSKSKTGVIKSVLFSFSKGPMNDQRDKTSVGIMPVYTEETVPSYLKALSFLDRPPMWDINKLTKAIEKAQNEAISAEEHIKYVKSLHKGDEWK